MRIPIERDSGVPLYQQIVRFLEAQIASGALSAESRLPASRELADSLGVGRLTVINAYVELEMRGLVYGAQGDGTYVAARNAILPHSGETTGTDTWPEWQQPFCRPAQAAVAGRLDALLATVKGEGVISFASGSGDKRLFPLEDFRRAMQNVLREGGKEVLEYGDPAGYPPLRALVAGILSGQGIPTRPGEVLITSGAQQALNLAVRLLVRPGETILCENPTHMGMIDLCRAEGIGMLAVPVDDEGMQVEGVEEALRTGAVRLIYSIPNFHNPTGTCMTSPRRRQLVTLAERYQVPVLEDDYIGDLRYHGAAQPALKALDGSGNVIYVGTFSKMLIPSLRVGYLVAHGPVLQRLQADKHTSDVATSNLMQRALQSYITVGRYQACLRKARQVFGKRLTVMLAALSRHMPAGTSWNAPCGGMYVWLRLPGGLSADEMFPLAAREGVVYAPGSFFFPDGAESACLRLNFAVQPAALIEEGVARLGRLIQFCMTTRR